MSGPDATPGGFPAEIPGVFDFLDTLGAYDFHDYLADFDFRSRSVSGRGSTRRACADHLADFDFRRRGQIGQQELQAAAWANFAHRQGKPVFLSEFGTMAYGWVPDKPGPSGPQAALAGSELVIRLANAGVDGFNRWSFLNRGDLDGQWQCVDTWDRHEKKLLP